MSDLAKLLELKAHADKLRKTFKADCEQQLSLIQYVVEDIQSVIGSKELVIECGEYTVSFDKTSTITHRADNAGGFRKGTWSSSPSMYGIEELTTKLKTLTRECIISAYEEDFQSYCTRMRL